MRSRPSQKYTRRSCRFQHLEDRILESSNKEHLVSKSFPTEISLKLLYFYVSNLSMIFIVCCLFLFRANVPVLMSKHLYVCR